MADVAKVTAAAQRLGAQKDETALEILIGKREKAIALRPELKDDPEFDPAYESQLMGPLDDVKALGRRILNRWNKELHGLVCDSKADDKDRQAILKALNLGEVAVIGAVAGALITLAVPAAIAAAVAPLVVKRFIWPARAELCDAWREAIERSK